jgi:hypothetical protein
MFLAQEKFLSRCHSILPKQKGGVALSTPPFKGKSGANTRVQATLLRTALRFVLRNAPDAERYAECFASLRKHSA